MKGVFFGKNKIKLKNEGKIIVCREENGVPTKGQKK